MRRFLLVVTLGIILSGCTHTYTVTKKDNTKECINASYYMTEGAYAHFYIIFRGLVKTVQANEIRRATDEEIATLEVI